MSKSKGKQPATTTSTTSSSSNGGGSVAAHVPNPPPLPNPSAGSANPAASLSALWGYIQPALDHILRSPTNNTNKAPAVEIGYHMGIHTATYNYFTGHCEGGSVRMPLSIDPASTCAPSGTDLYEQLDRYFASVTRELLLGAPQDDSATLIRYILPCFGRYAAGAHAIHRLLNYMNRHFVKREVDEDRGWLRVNDVLDSVIKTIKEDDTRDQIAKRLRDKRTDDLKKWGYVDEGSAELMTQAEACAEAASSLDRIVPLSSLALRRFRTELIEPLLAVPKVKGKARPKNKKHPPQGNVPKGRLARAVKDLLESEGIEEDERRRLAAELAIVLKTVGIRHEHPLRKRLDKFVAIDSRT